MKGKLCTVLAVVVILSLGLAACGPSQAELDAQATRVAAEVFATQTAEAPTPTHTPTTTPTLTPTPTPLSVAAIFARVSPSVAFIDTPAGKGSGVLTEGGYVVTNAHVVWPFQEVRVVFPDGSEYHNVPVLNWDLLSDLAIIGPLQTPISPVVLVDGEDLIIGSDVFLLGYPGEVDQFPQPTITRGLISRLREWEPIEMTYFQTDATIAGGQSGGVLVSEEGEVIGISGLWFTEAGFGVVASATDVLPRIQRLIADEDVAGLGDRGVSLLEEGQLEHDFTLGHNWDRSIYVINEPIGTVVDITVEGENDAAFGLVDVFGNVLISANEGDSGVETGSATTKLAAPHFLILGSFSEGPGDFHVSSNCGLVPYDDVDDGTSVTIGQTLRASMDYPGDTDYFVIDLAAGDIINITADSVKIDPFLIVGYPEAKEEELVSDDDSGGGSFGVNAELIYRAPHSGSYFIIIEDAVGNRVGGYFLTVAPPPPGATPVAPRPTPTPTATPEPTSTPIPAPTPTPIPTPTIPMALYESAQYPFAIQYPAQWAEQPKEEEIYTVAYAEDSAALFIVEEDLIAQGAEEMTLKEYVDLVLFMATQLSEDFELVSRQRTVNAQGLPVEIIVFTTGPGGIFKASRLIYLHEKKIGFNATYFALKGKHQELEPVIAFSFSTFRIR
jgi:S1-C subfamily serine protease